MSRSTDLARWAAGTALALVLAGGALAQSAAPAAPAAPSAAPATAAPGGIQSQNIFSVKDASTVPGYDKQSNGERGKVQPGNNAPMWRQVGSGMQGTVNLPASQAPEAGVLVQPLVQYPGSRLTTAGEAWRQVRNHWLVPYGGALVLIVLGALAIFFFARGPLGHSDNTEPGRRIERFTPFERSAHWANAVAFSLLAISGIVMAFGKFFLLPVMGVHLFGWLSYALKNVHNFVGPVFAVSLVIVFITFVKDNLPQSGDLRWAVRLGGLMSREPGSELPSHRFNFVEKAIFWGGVFLLGIVATSSGLVLDKLLPIAYDRQVMQYANMVHNVAAVLMVCMFLAHIYIGTIGMRGAYGAMQTGWVSQEWAKEHHAYWYEDIQAGKIPAERSTRPAVPADAVRPA